jgi:hypothetical protein
MLIPCICPALPDGTKRHASDTVDLRPRLGFRDVDTIKQSLAVMYLSDPDAGFADIFAAIREGYILLGIESWSLMTWTEADGDVPLPVTKPNIRRYVLEDHEAAGIIADAADELYAEAVMRPLLRAASTSSPPTPTEPSTSPPTGSSESPTPTPSSPSSTTTSPTDDTGTTTSPPAGDSNSSPSLASVA